MNKFSFFQINMTKCNFFQRISMFFFQGFFFYFLTFLVCLRIRHDKGAAFLRMFIESVDLFRWMFPFEFIFSQLFLFDF